MTQGLQQVHHDASAGLLKASRFRLAAGTLLVAYTATAVLQPQAERSCRSTDDRRAVMIEMPHSEATRAL